MCLHSLNVYRYFQKTQGEASTKTINSIVGTGPKGDVTGEALEAVVKERHSSGESDDSAIASSPTNANTFTVGSPEANGEDEDDDDGLGGSEDSCFLPPDVSTSSPKEDIKGILKQQRRCLSESASEPIMSYTADEDDDSGSVCSGGKKSVRFNEVVQRKVFRPNASILGQRNKNAKKSEQKRRRAERRASEGDGDSVPGTTPDKFRHQNNDSKASDPHNDSGVASSLEESNNGSSKGNKNKKKQKNNRQRNNNVKSGGNNKAAAPPFESDLIFDLDI